MRDVFAGGICRCRATKTEKQRAHYVLAGSHSQEVKYAEALIQARKLTMRASAKEGKDLQSWQEAHMNLAAQAHNGCMTIPE